MIFKKPQRYLMGLGRNIQQHINSDRHKLDSSTDSSTDKQAIIMAR